MASKMNEFQAVAPATDFHERLANAVLKFSGTRNNFKGSNNLIINLLWFKLQRGHLKLTNNVPVLPGLIKILLLAFELMNNFLFFLP